MHSMLRNFKIFGCLTLGMIYWQVHKKL